MRSTSIAASVRTAMPRSLQRRRSALSTAAGSNAARSLRKSRRAETLVIAGLDAAASMPRDVEQVVENTP